MAIYHLSVKVVSRSAGRSATAAAAYRAGARIVDARTGDIHDYTRKGGVESADLVLPENAPEWAADRSALWNAAEQAERRKNSTVAREFEIALPSELSPEERRRLAVDFAREIVARHGCAADVAIHAPSRDGDFRNAHAHILVSTRRLAAAKGFTEKTRELDERDTREIVFWRERWAVLVNSALTRSGSSARVDHRSNEDRGIKRAPGRHIGPAAMAIIRRDMRDESRMLADEEAEYAATARRRDDIRALDAEMRTLGMQIDGMREAEAQARAQAEREREREAVEARRRAEAAEFALAVAAAQARKKRKEEEAEADRRRAADEAARKKAAARATEKPVEAESGPYPPLPPQQPRITPTSEALAAWRAKMAVSETSTVSLETVPSPPAPSEPAPGSSPRPEDAEREARRARLYAEWYTDASPYLRRQYDCGETHVADTWVNLHERWEIEAGAKAEDGPDDDGWDFGPR